MLPIEELFNREYGKKPGQVEEKSRKDGFSEPAPYLALCPFYNFYSEVK
jgi:hypothetical protein